MARLLQSTPKIYALRKIQTELHKEQEALLNTKQLGVMTSTTNNEDYDSPLKDRYYVSDKVFKWDFVSRSNVGDDVSKCKSDLSSIKTCKRKIVNGNCRLESFSTSDLEEFTCEGKFYFDPPNSTSTGFNCPILVHQSMHSENHDQNHRGSSNLQSKRKKEDSTSTSNKDSSSEDEDFKRKLLHKKRMYETAAMETPTLPSMFKGNEPVLTSKRNRNKEVILYRSRKYSSSDSECDDDFLDEIFNFSVLNLSSSTKNILSEIQPTSSNAIFPPNMNYLSQKFDAIPIEFIMARLRSSEKIQEVVLSRNFRKKCTIKHVPTKYPPKRKIFRKLFRKQHPVWTKARVDQRSSGSKNWEARQLINYKFWTEFLSETEAQRKKEQSEALSSRESIDKKRISNLENVTKASFSVQEESAGSLFPENWEKFPFPISDFSVNIPHSVLEKLGNISVLERPEGVRRSIYANPDKMSQSDLGNVENMPILGTVNVENMSFETTELTDDTLNARKC